MKHTLKETIDQSVMSVFFQKNIVRLFPRAKNFDSLQIHRHITMAKEDYIIRYTLRIRLKNGGRETVFIRGVARADGSKRLSHQIMHILWTRGFQKGRYSLPRPLIYRSSVKQFLYEEFPGETLYQIMENRQSDIRAPLQDAARWLAKLHNMRIQKSVLSRSLSEEKKWISDLMPLFRKTQWGNDSPQDATPILQELWEREKTLLQPSLFVLIHNDISPGNIIIGEKVGCIDFVDSCRFYPLVDVGTMLTYLHSPVSPLIIKHRVNGKSIERLQDMFLKTYIHSLRPPLYVKLTDVRLFQARAAIMMAMHIAKLSSRLSPLLRRGKHNPRVLEILLQQAVSYLKQSY